MAAVVSMGYLVITAENLETWSSFAEQVLGMRVEPFDDALQLRMDDRTWRFRVERGTSEHFALGLEVVSDRELDELASALHVAGYVVKEDLGLARERGVRALVQVQDPDGYAVELFYGAQLARDPFISPVGTRFVTGTQGFGHVVLRVTDLDAARRFYMDALGFRLSDIIERPGQAPGTVFTHLAPGGRHHSLGLGLADGDSYMSRPGLKHFMVQVEEIDMVGRSLDKVLRGAATLADSLGRHSNDHMISFYCFAPSGLRIEYGFGGRTIDDATWSTSTYDHGSVWGHIRQPAPQFD